MQKIANLRLLPNVFIHGSLQLGESSEIDVSKVCKEVNIGENVSTKRFCSFLIFPNARLVIQKNVFFNNCCSVNCLGDIEIGENTLFGEGVKIYDHNHLHAYINGNLTVEKAEFKIGSVKIGKNCWIASNVTILNNVEIGDNVIIGANCLIYKSIPPNSIVKSAMQLIIDNLEKQ